MASLTAPSGIDPNDTRGSNTPITNQNKPLDTNYNIAAFPAVGENPLNKFVSFNCLFTLACLSKEQQAAGVFNKSSLKNVIARSQGDWGSNNRVNATWGQFDYFIDDLIIVSQPAISTKTGEAFATKITFKVTEPYSLGLFLDTMLVGSQASGYPNFREACYLLMIEFAGYTDDNKPNNPDPNLTRYIPIKFIDVHLKLTSAGSVYECEVIPYNETAFRSPTSNTKTTVKITGDTVADMLSKQLTSQLLSFEQNLVKDKEVSSTDIVEIAFPTSFTDKNNSMNEIGSSKMFTDFKNGGSNPFPDQDKILDTRGNIYKQSPVTIISERTFQYNQNTKIEEIIRSVIIRSQYIINQLTNSAVLEDPKGMINWFRIESRIQDLADNPTINRQNKKIIYRVVPYRVHISKLLPPNTIPPGYDNLKKTVNRIYNYTYTGLNTEIISVDLDFNMAFFSQVVADAGSRPGTSNPGVTLDNPANPPKDKITTPTTGVVDPTGATLETIAGKVRTDPSGSGDAKTAQVQNYRDLLTNDADMVEVKMTIRGDPYYLPSSGMGNQIGTPVGDNLMSDGSMNYQNGEVDIVINFRTPIDLNPVTGLYTFSAVVDQFSGLFQIFEVESKFNQNKFTQTLTLMRRRAQLIGSANRAVILSQVTG